MITARPSALAAVLLFGAHATVVQAQNKDQETPTADEWTETGIAYGCAAKRLTSEKPVIEVALSRTIRGDPAPEIVLTFVQRGQLTEAYSEPVTARITGETAEIGTGYMRKWFPKPKSRTQFDITLNDLGKQKFDQGIEKDTTLSVRSGKDVVATIPIGSFTTAGVNVDACFDKYTGELPFRRPPGESLTAPARGPLPRNMIRWVSSSDYRTSWIAKKMEGTVHYAITVNRFGYGRDCTITATSGFEDMDRQTCRLLMRRARFYPAINNEQEGVSGDFQGGVRWQFPE